MQKRLEELTQEELSTIIQELETHILNDGITDIQKLTYIMLALYDSELVTWSY